jgi:hypothetical protein
LRNRKKSRGESCILGRHTLFPELARFADLGLLLFG